MASASPLNFDAGNLPRRPYGRQGVELSIIGFGAIVVMNMPQEQANRTVAQAVEAGVNYFDVAPTYGDAEQRLGPALEPYRRNCFLACKTVKRGAEAARAHLKQSFINLRTDYLDLYQLHAITDVGEDVDDVFAKGGAMEVLLEAKKSGQVRHLGFSAHSTEAALAAMDRYDFDSVLVPVNFAAYHSGDFGPTMVSTAKAKGISVLALKALARQKWPGNDPLRKKYSKCWYQPLTDPHEQELALRFTLSQPVTSALPPGEEELFWAAVQVAMRFTPIDAQGEKELAEMAAALDPVFSA